MGQQWAKDYPSVAAYFEKADSVLGRPISRIAFQGPPEELNRTVNGQPAIFVLNCGCYALWRDFCPSAVAGHSLGEFPALVACGALSFDQALKMVEKRAELMQESAELSPGAMLAVLGLATEVVEKVVETNRTKGVVSLANYNCPGQVVVSCEASLLAEIERQLGERGAKKVVRLPVSGGFHSPLISQAAAAFGAYLRDVPFSAPTTVLVSNFSGRGTTDAAEIKHNILQQMSSPVRWEESIRWMLQEGISTFVELGPGRVLQGLIKRISKSVEVRSMEDASLDELQEWLRARIEDRE